MDVKYFGLGWFGWGSRRAKMVVVGTRMVQDLQLDDG